jgi:hypothetical protein
MVFSRIASNRSKKPALCILRFTEGYSDMLKEARSEEPEEDIETEYETTD